MVLHLPLLQGKLHPVCTEIKRDPPDFIWNCINFKGPSAFDGKVQTFWQQSMALRQQVSSTKTRQSKSCQKGQASMEDRGCATLIHQESVFNITTAILDEGQCESPNPQWRPWTQRDSSQHGLWRGQWEPHSVPCPPKLCSNHSTHPDRKKKAVWAPRTWVTGQCITVEQTCIKPHKKSLLKGNRREHRVGTSCCPRAHRCKATKQGGGGRSLQSQPYLDKSRGVSHVYTTSFDFNKVKRNKKENWAKEIHTWELPYGPCPAKHRETREKRKWKKGQSVTETNKTKILFKKT